MYTLKNRAPQLKIAMVTFCILLATYNGQEYIAAQLNSILAQKYENWTLIIRDDESTDGTIPILKEYVGKDSRITLHKNFMATGSAQKNFALLANDALDVQAEFYLFCDQDDYWHPDKLQHIACHKATYESTKPTLIHHDLIVTNANLVPISDSFVKQAKINPCPNPNHLLKRNSVTGCTMAINRSLLKAATPIPKQAIMHDWWFALVAAFTGKIHYIDRALTHYRQHGNNAVGAKPFYQGLNPFTNWSQGWQRGNLEFLSTILQARSLAEHMKQKSITIKNGSLLDIQEYSNILEKKPIARISVFSNLGFTSENFILVLVTKLRLLTIRKIMFDADETTKITE